MSNNPITRRQTVGLLAMAAGFGARPAKAADAEWKAIEDAASKEGLVNIYHDFSPTGVQQIIELFRKRYPAIEVREVRLPSGGFYSRFPAEYEAGKSEADMCSMAYDDKLLDWQKDGWYANWTPPEASHLPPTATIGQGLWEIQRAREMIIYNKTKVKAADAPKEWTDLFDPKWKGRIGMNPPWRSVGPQSVIVYIQQKFNIADMAQKMKEQDIRFFNGSAGVVQAVIRGDVAVAILTDLPLNMVLADDPPVGAVYPASGVPSSPFLLFVPAKAKHPNAGKVFSNWVMSEEGQVAIQDLSGAPALRVGIPAPKYVPANTSLKLVDIRTLLTPANQKETVEHWQTVFGVK